MQVDACQNELPPSAHSQRLYPNLGFDEQETGNTIPYLSCGIPYLPIWQQVNLSSNYSCTSDNNEFPG
jgi:hypothetical protein